MRYVDDAVLGFQKHQHTVNCLSALTERLAKFGLKIHPDKTKLVRFGRDKANLNRLLKLVLCSSFIIDFEL